MTQLKQYHFVLNASFHKRNVNVQRVSLLFGVFLPFALCAQCRSAVTDHCFTLVLLMAHTFISYNLL